MPHKDPDKKREYGRQWYLKHAEQERARNKQRYEAIRAAGLPWSYPKPFVCPDCGWERERKVGQMDRKHPRDTQGRFLVRCKSCAHRTGPRLPGLPLGATPKERQNWLKHACVIYKGGKCQDCGYLYTGQNAYAFDFHHLIPATKRFRVNTSRSRAWDQVVAEIEGCDLLCAICHRARHWAYDEPPSNPERSSG